MDKKRNYMEKIWGNYLEKFLKNSKIIKTQNV